MRKTTIHFVMSVLRSVRTSVCVELSSHWKDFDEIWYLSIFIKSVDKIQVLLKSDKKRYCTWDRYAFMITSRWILLVVENFSEKCRENQNTRLMFCYFFRKLCRSWDKVEEYGPARQATGDNIVWRTRLACWNTKATGKHSEYWILIAFLLHKSLRESTWLLRCTSMSCIVERPYRSVHFQIRRQLTQDHSAPQIFAYCWRDVALRWRCFS